MQKAMKLKKQSKNTQNIHANDMTSIYKHTHVRTCACAYVRTHSITLQFILGVVGDYSPYEELPNLLPYISDSHRSKSGGNKPGQAGLHCVPYSIYLFIYLCVFPYVVSFIHLHTTNLNRGVNMMRCDAMSYIAQNSLASIVAVTDPSYGTAQDP